MHMHCSCVEGTSRVWSSTPLSGFYDDLYHHFFISSILFSDKAMGSENGFTFLAGHECSVCFLDTAPKLEKLVRHCFFTTRGCSSS